MRRTALRRVVGTALAGVLALGCRDGNPAAVAEVASGRFRAEATGAVRATLEGNAELLLPLGESMEVELRDAGTQRTIVFAGGGLQTVTSFQPFRFGRASMRWGSSRPCSRCSRMTATARRGHTSPFVERCA